MSCRRMHSPCCMPSHVDHFEALLQRPSVVIDGLGTFVSKEKVKIKKAEEQAFFSILVAFVH